MKILHILDHSVPLHSGYSFRSESILREQVKRGWEPVAVTSPKHEQSWKRTWQSCETINGIKYYRTGLSRSSRVPLASEVLLMRALAKRIAEVAKAEQPDVLHAHSPLLNAIPALWAGGKLSIPVVYEIRAFWEDAAVDHGTYRENSLKYRLVRGMETLVSRQVDHIGILCEGLKRDLIARGVPSGKITIVYNGIDPDEFKGTKPAHDLAEAWQLNGKTVIGFIGSFYRYEGLDLLVDAFSQLASERPEVVLLLVGGGEVEDELREQVRRLGLDGRVLMPGRIEHDRVSGVYALMNVLIYPRYSMRLTELVTPLKPLEAMAMGKALIASDVGGHRELIRDGETGILFNAGSVASLADAMELLLNDPELSRRFQGQGAAWVKQNHMWEKTTSVYAHIYAAALQGKAGGLLWLRRSKMQTSTSIK